jgi:hypothetical protein
MTSASCREFPVVIILYDFALMSGIIKNDPDMLEEYDFTGGVRGKYAKRFEEGTNIVVIEPDVAEYFPDHDSVNEALRSLAKIIKRQSKAQQGAEK